MQWTKVGGCPTCGAPIYTVADLTLHRRDGGVVFEGIGKDGLPPESRHTCDCRWAANVGALRHGPGRTVIRHHGEPEDRRGMLGQPIRDAP